jgi:GMP synthase (glutamine-hydrolysing)
VTARLLVIQHEDLAPLAWFGDWLTGAGVECSVVSGHHGDPVPSALEGYDGLLVLGGEMGAYDDERHPWLTPTKARIADAVDRDVAFLGICLGHQLAAVALGGTVQRNPAGAATGLTPVGLTEEGRRDPLLGSLDAGIQAVQWNNDIVSALTPHHHVLALAPDGTIQAARFGARAWGVQFHPEASPDVFASWGRAARDARPGAPDVAVAASAAATVRAAELELRRTWRPVAVRFAEIMSGGEARRGVAVRPSQEGDWLSTPPVRAGRLRQ